MMKTLQLICLLLAVVACRAVMAIDLTPHIVQRVMHQRSYDCPYFLDGKTRYTVNLPFGASVWGEKGVAHFNFADTDGAGFVMQSSPLTPGLPFSGPSLEVYRRTALSFIPDKATDPAIAKEKPNSLAINEWGSFEFIVTSNIPGMRMMQSVTFLNFSPSDQIVLVTTAGANHFKEAVTKSSEIMRSFRKVEPNEDLSAPQFP